MKTETIDLILMSKDDGDELFRGDVEIPVDVVNEGNTAIEKYVIDALMHVIKKEKNHE
jgi:hypothetical protein